MYQLATTEQNKVCDTVNDLLGPILVWMLCYSHIRYQHVGKSPRGAHCPVFATSHEPEITRRQWYHGETSACQHLVSFWLSQTRKESFVKTWRNFQEQRRKQKGHERTATFCPGASCWRKMIICSVSETCWHLSCYFISVLVSSDSRLGACDWPSTGVLLDPGPERAGHLGNSPTRLNSGGPQKNLEVLSPDLTGSHTHARLLCPQKSPSEQPHFRVGRDGAWHCPAAARLKDVLEEAERGSRPTWSS